MNQNRIKVEERGKFEDLKQEGITMMISQFSHKRIGQALGLVALGFTLFIVSAGYGQNSTPTQGCVLDAGANRPPNEGVPTDYSRYLEPKGEITGVMIFLDFSDAPATETTTDLYNLLVPHAVEWFAEVSYGRMSLSITPIHTWYRMPKASTTYNLARDRSKIDSEFFPDAIRVADADVDFRQYKLVILVPSKDAAVPLGGGNSLPGGRWTMTADGVENRHRVLLGTDTREPEVSFHGQASHVLIHETGHVFGLPDLYNMGANRRELGIFRDVGGWDIMSWTKPAAHFLAWQKWKLGWLDASQMLCLNSGQIEETITPLEVSGGVKAIAVLTSRSTAYVVEVRQLIGQDSRLCDQGVLVYKVDATARTGFQPIVLKPAQNGNDPELFEKCGPLYDAPFDLGPGEVSKFELPSIGLSIEVLSQAEGRYKVRVTKQVGDQE
jgi:M6 family metalloprotease-like protein